MTSSESSNTSCIGTSVNSTSESNNLANISQMNTVVMDISSCVEDGPVQPRNYCFSGTHFGNKVRSFNPTWFDKYVWLEYSISNNAVFCYACRFFTMGLGSHRAEDSFIKIGYRDWKHATGKTGGLVKHDISLRHKHAMAAWSDYKDNQKQHTSVATVLDNCRKEQISHNRHYMKTIIEALLFCASQEIGF